MAENSTVVMEWERWPGTLRGFARDLDRRGVPYLSYSKVASLESCEQRYYLVPRLRSCGPHQEDQCAGSSKARGGAYPCG